MRRIISVTLVTCLLGLSFVSEAADFTNCGSTIGQFSSVSVSGCDDSKQACDLIRGTNATISIQFTVDKSIEKVTTVVHALVMDVLVPFPMPHSEACTNPESGITCPLKQGVTYNYHATLPVETKYPRLSVTVKWELQNENKEDIVCVYIPAKIK